MLRSFVAVLCLCLGPLPAGAVDVSRGVTSPRLTVAPIFSTPLPTLRLESLDGAGRFQLQTAPQPGLELQTPVLPPSIIPVPAAPVLLAQAGLAKTVAVRPQLDFAAKSQVLLAQHGTDEASAGLSQAFDGRTSPPAAVAMPEPAADPVQVSFFFNDHDASASYQAELSAFVRRHDAVLVESLKSGPQLKVFQAVSYGKLTPEAALKRLTTRHEPMDLAVLRAFHGSGVEVLPESVLRPENAARRRRIDDRLILKAQDALSEAHDSFYEEGDAAGAVSDLLEFQTSMAAVHRLREEVLLADLRARVRRSPAASLGVIFGEFHTRPFEELKAAGVKVSREFHPGFGIDRGEDLTYNRPLMRLRAGQAAAHPARERKELLSYLFFYELLDRRFRGDRFAAQKAPLYSDMLGRLTWTDLEKLALEVSSANEQSTDRDEARLAGVALRWLTKTGAIRPDERRYFRYR